MRTGIISVIAVLQLLSAVASEASPVSEAQRMRALRFMERLIGIRPHHDRYRVVVDEVATLLEQGELQKAAATTLNQSGLEEAFLSLTIRDWATRFTNAEQSSFSLAQSGGYEDSDVLGFVTGLVRQNRDARDLLMGDMTYLYRSSNRSSNFSLEQQVAPIAFEKFNPFGQADLEDDAYAGAGIFLSGDWATAFYMGGTNRRAVKATLEIFLCRPIESFMDFGISDHWVRRDVDRHPGGSYQTYRKRCVGCHAGMDALGGAFARIDGGEDRVFYGDEVQPKMNQNKKVFPSGNTVKDDSWENFWIKSSPIKKGRGIQQFGKMVAQSSEFPGCMAKSVYEKLCAKKVDSQSSASVEASSQAFIKSGYRLRVLFESVAGIDGCLAKRQGS